MQSDVRRRGGRQGKKRRKPAHLAKESERTSDKRRLVQLLVCIGIFLMALGLKTFYPGSDAVGVSVVSELSRSGSYRETFSALGEALTSGGNIVDTFKELANVVFSPARTEGDTGVSEESVGTKARVRMLAGARAGQLPSPSVGDASETESGDIALGAGGGEPLDDEAFVDEFLLKLSPEDESDGSPYDMFDTPAPERVSFERMEFTFAHMTPVGGTVTSKFGYRDHPIDGMYKFHYGIDIGTAMGTPIVAFADGVVESKGTNEVYGNYLFLRHDNGIITFYGHCKSVLVDKGDTVLKGSKVALVGSTGKSTGPHLHFEVRNDNIILDPTPYLTLGA